jgi:hypothetical protein
MIADELVAHIRDAFQISSLSATQVTARLQARNGTRAMARGRDRSCARPAGRDCRAPTRPRWAERRFRTIPRSAASQNEADEAALDMFEEWAREEGTRARRRDPQFPPNGTVDEVKDIHDLPEWEQK